MFRVRPSICWQVDVAVATHDPLRLTQYPATPTLSLEGLQQTCTDVRVLVEVKLVGVVGGWVSVKTGVAVLQVLVPDRPGALADLTACLGQAGVNIEDLSIVHSPEGGRGTVHLTVAAAASGDAARALRDRGFEPLRLA